VGGLGLTYSLYVNVQTNRSYIYHVLIIM
jgi:hypothetical protein